MSKVFSAENLVVIGIILFLALKIFPFADHCLWIDESREGYYSRNYLSDKVFLLNDEDVPPRNRHFLFLTQYLGTILATNPEVGITLPSIVLFILLLAHVYKYLKEKFSKKVGIIGTIITGFNPLTLFLATRAISDLPYVSLTIMGVYYFDKYYKTKKRKELIISAMLLGSSLITKEPSFINYIILFFYALYKERTKILKKKDYYYFAIITILFIVFFTISNQIYYGNPLGKQGALRQAITGESGIDQGPFYFYLLNLNQIIPSQLFLLLIVGLGFAVSLKDDSIKLMVALFIAYFLFYSYWPVKVLRFSMILIPLASIIISAGIYSIGNILEKELSINKEMILITAIFLILFQTYPQVNTGVNNIETRSQSFCGYDKAAEFTERLSLGENEVILASGHHHFKFYTRSNNFKSLPRNQTKFNRMLESGTAKFFVFDRWERTQPQYLVQEVQSQNHSLIYPPNPTQNSMIFIFRAGSIT